MNRPFFSIITITNNDPDGFRKTADSILNQSFTDLEWIIVHGGKDQATKDIVAGLMAKYPDKAIQFISGQDTGLYNAMNVGINHATGYYLDFMNGGDILYAVNTLRDMHAAIVQQTVKPDFIYGDGIIDYGDKQILHKGMQKNKIARYWYRRQPAIHQAEFYALDVVKQKNLTYTETYKVASDIEFTMRFIWDLDPQKILYLQQTLCVFEGTGISNRRLDLAAWEQVDIVRKNYPRNYPLQLKALIRLYGAYAVKTILQIIR